jgi:hypothetical protein
MKFQLPCKYVNVLQHQNLILCMQCLLSIQPIIHLHPQTTYMWDAPIQSLQLQCFGCPCKTHTHLCLWKWTCSLFNNTMFISWRIQLYIWPTGNSWTFTNSTDLSRSTLFATQKLDTRNSNLVYFTVLLSVLFQHRNGTYHLTVKF